MTKKIRDGTAVASVGATDAVEVSQTGGLTTQFFATMLQIATYIAGALAAIGVAGTTTNDDAATGKIGEYVSAVTSNATATVTITIASPGVVSWTAHGLGVGSAVTFTTTGALPTGLTAGTAYYVIAAGLTANAFQVSATPFGSAINTSGTQSGTHTGTSNVNVVSVTNIDVAAISLTAGDWDVDGLMYIVPSGAVPTNKQGWTNSVSATQPTAPSSGGIFLSIDGGTASQSYVISTRRFSFASTTTVFMTARSNYTGGSTTAYGHMRARRVR